MIHHFANRVVSAGDSILRLSDFYDLLEDVGSIRVQRDHALSVSFSHWYTQPRMAVGVGVQAIDGEAANLVSACASPPNKQERRALVQILEFINGRYHGV